MKLFLALLITLGAHAQESVQLEEISVRGNKEDRTYEESQESITLFDEGFLAGAGRENDLQVLNAVPNVQVNRGGESFSIRGISNTGVTGFQKDNLASILVDDVFQTELAADAGSFELWDLGRLEVLRGAQSTSQGVNSLAGTILLYHNRPAFDWSGAAKVGVASFRQREFGVAANQNWLADKLASRVYYNRETSGGFVTNTYE